MGKKRKSMRDKAKKRADGRSSGGVEYLRLPEDTEFMKVKKGRQKFSIVPYEVSVNNHPEVEAGELWYQRTIWVHYGVGADEEAVICPLKTLKKKCPICEQRLALSKDPDADDDDVYELKPKEREVFNVHHDDEFKILAMSYHTFGKLLEEEIREDEDIGGFADIEDGNLLSVRWKEESGGGYKYITAGKIDFKPRKDFDDSVLNDVVDLDTILIVKDYDELHNLFWDLEPEDRKKTDKTDKKKTKRSEKKKTEKEDKPEKKKPKKSEKKKPAKKDKKKKEKLTCPEDLEFGKDFDGYECCDDCDIRKECKSEGKSDPDTPEKDSSDESSESKGDCPHGHTFGEDCNDKDECDNCSEWEPCQDALDTINK